MLGVDYSSKFAPFLSTGVLSVRRVWAEIEHFELLHGASEGSEWLKFELLWREYFRWLEGVHGASFYSHRGFRDLELMKAIPDQERFKKWTQGETGHDFIDANMKELFHTGYMSNRGRQNVASYLIHELQLPWWWGAEYFSKMLIDSDPAQNYGNWSYLAGVGSDPRSFGGKPRKFDPDRQAEMYDPDGSFRKLWLPRDLASAGSGSA
jgi:deoxyribodipyrimidine photo-lyase